MDECFLPLTCSVIKYFRQSDRGGCNAQRRRWKSRDWKPAKSKCLCSSLKIQARMDALILWSELIPVSLLEFWGIFLSTWSVASLPSQTKEEYDGDAAG